MTRLVPETVTHARLRAQQGDTTAAVRILEAVLARRPGDAEAAALLADLPRARVRAPEPAEAAPGPPTGARAEDLAGPFRRALSGGAGPRTPKDRLSRFLAAVTRHAR